MSINTADLTTESIEGDGVFDVLMKSVALHLKTEFDAGRIRGNDYATVYTAAIGQAMGTAAQYALAKPGAEQEVLNLQATLTGIEAQTAKTEAETTNIQAALPNIQLQDDLTTAQIAQVEKAVEKATEEIALVAAQTKSEQAKVSHTVATADSILGQQAALVAAQVAKAEAEEALLIKKEKTECAQTEDVAVSNSVIGRQLTLYANQAKGYDVDQKVKVAKLFTDIAAVQLNINENYDTAGTGLENSAIADATTTARNSV